MVAVVVVRKGEIHCKPKFLSALPAEPARIRIRCPKMPFRIQALKSVSLLACALLTFADTSTQEIIRGVNTAPNCSGNISSVVWGRVNEPMYDSDRHFGSSIAGGVNLLLQGVKKLGPNFEFAEAWNVSCPTTYHMNPAEAVNTQTQHGLWFPCAFKPVLECTPIHYIEHEDLFRMPCYSHDCQTLEYQRETFRKYIRLQPRVRSLVNELKANFSEASGLPSRYSAFQIRRGDKCMWGPLDKAICHGCEASCVGASEFLRRVPGASVIFVMTDDFSVVEEVQNLTTARVVCDMYRILNFSSMWSSGINGDASLPRP